MKRTRVLCYAPYNRWIQHAAWEITVVHALRQRGADVRHVFCDGLYRECDVFPTAVDRRHALSCLQCQAEVAGIALRMQAPYEWLGRWVAPEELREAAEWSRSLAPAALPAATYRDWPLGDWVAPSVHLHLRRSELDLADPVVESVYRGYVEGALVAGFALTRLLDEERPDVVLLFNGLRGSLRVMLELARRRRIRVVCHERGFQAQALALFENTHCLSFDQTREMWGLWGRVPLRRAEIARVTDLLQARAEGRGLAWPAYSPPPQETTAMRARLGLSAARPLWALFTSSDDEVVALPDCQGAFGGQREWLHATIQWVARRPELDLVVRVHPNLGGKRSHGRNERQLAQMEALRATLPANVRLVMPDDPVSSYSLMELATVGLVYQSTVACEMAALGAIVNVAGASQVRGLPFVDTVVSEGDYHAMLDARRDTPAGFRSPEIRRLAYRFIYGLFVRLAFDFPLVSMAEGGQVGFTFGSVADLAPGKHPSLDRIVSIVLDADPVCPLPTVADLMASDEDERAWFGLAGRPPKVPA